jgi:WD40 repeat protein/tRNA A-37 threonylcarbamoyl transferase component Bud32
MSERSIFLNALDREDPAERAAYLDEACAGKPELRKRIERLLRSHAVVDTFLDVPAPEQLARGDQALTFLAPSSEPGRLGRLDQYEVLEVVGRGATGVVLKARDTKLQRVVALKVLAPRLAASRPARERFVREAQATAAVRDDHVIAIYAVNDDGAIPYLVMEYIAGLTLDDRIKQAGPLDLPEVLRIGLQVASGLAAAHAQGLIHRDIKPANILLENGVQRVKITDFGLARATAEAGLAERGAVAGTPPYMAPCQARGEPQTERSDLFSLGAVLYALCTGRPPFGGDTTAAVLRSVCEDTPQPIRAIRPDLPDDLGDLIGKLLAKDPRDRPGSAREVADLLTDQLARAQKPLAPSWPGTAPIVPQPAEKPAPAPVGPSVWRRRLLLACVVVLLAGLAALAAALKPWQRWTTGRGSADTAARERRHPAAPIDLRREDIPPMLLALAGGGDPAQAPPELVAVLGDGPFRFPQIGYTWGMEQSPDGKVLAVSHGEDVVLFDATAGAYLRSLKGPGGRVMRVTFSRDGRLLAATTWDPEGQGAVRVWDLRADRELYTNPYRRTRGTAFSADGTRLVVKDPDRLLVWEARSGKEMQNVELHQGGVSAMCFSQDGRRLAVALWDRKCVEVFDWDGEKVGGFRTLDHPLPVMGVAFSPDGKFLASGDERGFKLWNAETLEEVRSVATPAQQLAFVPDSRILFAAVTTGPPKTVHTFTRWDVVANEELHALSVEVAAVPEYAQHCLSRDGKVLFVAHGGAYSSSVRAIDASSGDDLFPRRGHDAPLNAVAVSPDGRMLASGGEDRVVKVWDLADRRVLHSFEAHTGAVWGLAFSPDGRLLATGSRDGPVILWDVDSGDELRRLKGYSGSVSRLQFSPDGRTLAAGGEGGLVQLWDAASGQRRDPLSGHAGVVRCVAFSPDGKRLASSGEDTTVRLHDLAGGGSRKFTMPSAVNDVAFSPDGHTLAAVGDAPEAAVRLWDLDTGQETTWEGHTGHVAGLAFSPSAPLLATCGEDGTVRLWERTADGRRARTIGPGPFGGPVRSVAFTPDGRYLTTANANGTVYVLRVGAIP